MVNVTQSIESHREYLIHEAERIGEQLAQMGPMVRALRRLEQLPSFADVGFLSMSWDYSEKRPRITVSLAEDHQDTALLREIVAEFGGTLKKSVHYDGQTLDAKGTIEGLTLDISSYLPKTCRIVEEEYEIPASEARTGKRQRIVCEPPETDEQTAADAAASVKEDGVEQVV